MDAVAEFEDGQHFRTVLGHFPTGVAVITSLDPDGAPVGMTIGSFTSASLDPPLVAFFPGKDSRTFPKIQAAGHFCVNVLTEDQEWICRSFAAKGVDKFAGVDWQPGETGAPVIREAVAWIDCRIDDVREVGDHFIVIGSVEALEAVPQTLNPLLFFRGGYGQFSSPSLIAGADPDLLEHLRLVDVARLDMEGLADELDAECLAFGVIDQEIAILGSAGDARRGGSRSRVGQRSPFVAPLGPLFIAEDDEASRQAWMHPPNAERRRSPEAIRSYERILTRARDRGWSIVLDDPAQAAMEAAIVVNPQFGNSSGIHQAAMKLRPEAYEPDLVDGQVYDVRHLGVPVRDSSGRVVLGLSLYGLPAGLEAHDIYRIADRFLLAADSVSKKLAPSSGDSAHARILRGAADAGLAHGSSRK